MKRICIIFTTLLLFSACSSQKDITIKDSENNEFIIMSTTVEEIVNYGYEVCTTYGVPYTNLDQHVIEKKRWSYFDLYKDNKYIAKIGVLNNSINPQALKDGVLVYFSMNEESGSDDFIIAEQELSTIKMESLSVTYPKLIFKEIENIHQDRSSFEAKKSKLELTYSFDEDGEVISVTLRSLDIDF